VKVAFGALMGSVNTLLQKRMRERTVLSASGSKTSKVGVLCITQI
jgi:hypothetical protein